MMKKIIWMITVTAGLLSAQITALHEDDRELYEKYFQHSAAEFGVPAEILMGISFSETRWTHMKWNDGDIASSCSGMPRVYGVMGLWDNAYFGYSLRDAAALIGRTPQELKESPLQNIRGAAALLKKYYADEPKPAGFADGAIESWQNAVARLSGFPQPDLAHRRGLEIYSLLSTGYSRDRIQIKKREVELEKVRTFVRSIEEAQSPVQQQNSPEGSMSQPDYPLAKWNPAYSGNFGTSLIQQKFVVIHDVEGSYLGCISWFKNTSAGVSSQYVLNSHPNGVNTSTKSPNTTPDAPVGEVTQMVEEKYRAYHVGCWNSFMVGIEHEGYASVNGWYTPEGYASSAKLVKYLCDKYNIPKDRNHVIPHSEHQNATWRSWVNSTGQGFDPTCNTHTDPGPYWNWTSYMALVTTADTIRPVVTGAIPQSDLSAFPAYKEITVSFNTPMDITSANAAFSIAPSVAGTKVWNADNTVLTFDPSALLPWNTSFTVTIDTSAKNIARSRNLGTVPFVKTFTTVPLDTSGPALVRSYPAVNETGVSLYGDVVYEINEPVQTASLSNAIRMVDENNASISLAGAKNEVVMDKGIVSFTPLNLKPNKTYTLKLLAGVKDYYGNLSKTDVIYQFITSPDVVAAGTPLDNMDANTKGWQQPSLSDRSRMFDSAKTQLTFGSEKIKAGSGSAKLTYSYTTADSGVVEIKATGYPPIDFYSRVGFWISGDASNNSVEIHIAPNDQVLSVGKIYWRGWKFIQFPLSSVTGPNKIIKSIILRQESGAAKEGKVYFDETQVDATVTGVQQSSTDIPIEYSLRQNYPNPFNPATMISFTLPSAGYVKLSVYDMLGREVAVLADGMMQGGTYQQHFNASHFASGVYYYSLRTGSFVQTRSMLLVK
jgi:N-acetyl-anhydromuramyl-L-alanine amidase AmpD